MLEWQIAARIIPFKTVRNFLLANLCAVIPLWWIGFGWMPEQVKVEAMGTASVALLAGGEVLQGEEHGVWQGGTVWRFYLRKGMKWKDLAFRLPEGMDGGDVGRVRLEKWKLLALEKAGAGLERRDGRANEFVFLNPRFERVGVAQGKMPLIFAGIEALLLGLSWWCAMRHREEPWKTLLPPVLGVAFAVELLMQVALPVQSYMANRSAFSFTAGELGRAVGVDFAVGLILGGMALGLLTRCFGRWVLTLALAFAVCVYLESGILSAGLPRLNGDWWFFYNSRRALWDFAVWCAVFLAFAGFHAFLEKHQIAVALCLSTMTGASMLDVQREEEADRSQRIVDEFVPLETVIRNVSYSTNRNIMVFILDSLEREQAHAIMEDPEAGPGLREKFKGFTEYAENAGACPQTLTAVPNLLTGQYPGGEEGMADYAWSCYSSNSALAAFLEEGHAVYMTTVGLGCGYTTDRVDKETGPTHVSVLNSKGKDGGTWSVREISRWRWLPFGAKASGASLTELGGDASHELREWNVYPLLANGKARPDGRNVFLFVHTEGVHVPIRFNRRGETMVGHQDGVDAHVEQGIFVIGQLANLMDAYRKAGIYERSLIVVLGDHGGHGEQRHEQDVSLNLLPRRARPCLWVKPEGSSHDFVSSTLPTSHAKVSALLKASASQKLAEEEIQTILQADRRVYREMALWGNRWKDWMVDRNGGFTVEEGRPSGSGSVLPKPLRCGHLYSLYWKDMAKNGADIFFDGMEARAFPVFAAGTEEVTLSIRVPEPGRLYTLQLQTGESGKGRFHFRCNMPGQAWQEKNIGPYDVVELHAIIAGEDGMATIVCKRDSLPGEDITFPTLVLEKEP